MERLGRDIVFNEADEGQENLVCLARVESMYLQNCLGTTPSTLTWEFQTIMMYVLRNTKMNSLILCFSLYFNVEQAQMLVRVHSYFIIIPLQTSHP